MTAKYLSNHGKDRYKLVDDPKKKHKIIFEDKELAIKVIKDCRNTATYKFRTRLRFKQYNVILTKEQSVLTKNKKFI